ncbi:hypothetical protein CEXT_700471 [Caerostris extrusa]|uniref:Uncharacterized protein n=1 Tax=Caerostris extrusa TaxID=172846 RepID=A0AAV4RYW5_CAEEX|nr:hypothetical protein CEXT_700471 [Caerostris extrusa]
MGPWAFDEVSGISKSAFNTKMRFSPLGIMMVIPGDKTHALSAVFSVNKHASPPYYRHNAQEIGKESTKKNPPNPFPSSYSTASHSTFIQLRRGSYGSPNRLKRFKEDQIDSSVGGNLLR